MKAKHTVVTLVGTSFDTVEVVKRLVMLMLAKRDPDGFTVRSVDVRRAKCCARNRTHGKRASPAEPRP